MKIETVFDIGQRVKIVEPGHHGRVTEISIGFGSPSYKVEYWTNGESKTFWAKDFELTQEDIPTEAGLKP